MVKILKHTTIEHKNRIYDVVLNDSEDCLIGLARSKRAKLLFKIRDEVELSKIYRLGPASNWKDIDEVVNKAVTALKRLV
jgi:hypothetical protein